MNKELSIPTKSLCEFLFKFMLFMAVFDGIRAKTPIADQTSILKELCTFALLGFILLTLTSRVSKTVLSYSNFLLLLYLLSVGTVVILFNDVSNMLFPSLVRKELPSPFAMHFKNIEAIILVFVLLHYEQLTGRKIAALMNYFVWLCVSYIVLTVLVYFKFISTSFFLASWYGRISIGYPTSDTPVLCFALAYVVFVRNSLQGFIKALVTVVLIIGVIINASATGILAVGCIMVGYALYYIFSGKVFSLLNIRTIALAVIGIVAFTLSDKLVDASADNLLNYSTLLQTKYDFVVGKVNQTFAEEKSAEGYELDLSERVRKNQLDKTFSVQRDFPTLAFGGPISLGTLIENQNYFLIRSYGYIGFGLYYVWLLMFAYSAVKHLKHERARLLLAASAILIVSNSAIVTSYMFGITVSFGLCVSYFFHYRKQYVTENNPIVSRYNYDAMMPRRPRIAF